MMLDDEYAVLARVSSDPEAFGEIFDAYYPAIIKYLVRRTGSYAIAEDIASATFMRALLHIDHYQPRGISILAWLYRIAGNALNDHYRSSSRQIYGLSDEILEFLSHPDIDAETEQLQNKLDQQQNLTVALGHLRQLPIKYQEVIILHYLEGQKIREIAAATGKREGTIKSLLSRGIKLLQKSCNQPQSPTLYLIGGSHKAAPQEYYEA